MSTTAINHVLSQKVRRKSATIFLTQPLHTRTTVTVGQVVQMILNTCNAPAEIVSLSKWSAAELVEDRGFMSLVLRVFLTWYNPACVPGLPSSVIVKIPSLHKLAYLLNMVDSTQGEYTVLKDFAVGADIYWPMLHNCEVEFYSKLSNQLPISRPVYYGGKMVNGASDVGFLVIEDMRHSTQGDLKTGLHHNVIIQLTTQLAQLHAWSLTNTEKLAGLTKLGPSCHGLYSLLPGMTERSIQEFIKFVATNESMAMCLSDELKADTLANLKGNLQSHWLAENCHKQHQIPDVLCHGDFWINNVMLSDDQQSVDAIVDWQTAHLGNPMEDLTRLMITSTSAEFRATMTDVVLGHYRQILKEHLPDNIVPSFAAIRSLYEDTFRHVAVFQLPMQPMMIRSFQSQLLATDNVNEQDELQRNIDRYMSDIKSILIDTLTFTKIHA